MIDREWSGPGWIIAVGEKGFTVAQASDSVTVAAADAGQLAVRRRWFGRALRFGDRRPLRLRRISRSDASQLKRTIRHLALTPQIAATVAWYEKAADVLLRASTEQRWIPVETVAELVGSRPAQRLIDKVRAARTETELGASERAALDMLDADLEQVVAMANEKVMASELVSRKQFFDTIEKSALSEEQAKAVICFDNRVQLLAAAGSGKTSVMVARAAYAVSRGFVRPERILLLAFNRDAANELQERVDARFAAAGIDSGGVRASTFHSFGLDVIGRATGTKPRVASWLEHGDGLDMIERIVDALRDRDEQFRYRWDLYRLLFAKAPIRIEDNEPDGWDADSKENGYKTFGGHIVRSHGERLIADFLYLNGVDYAYEKTYPHTVVDATHGRYRPDFYYPGIDVWHEHWALDRNGNPPPSFAGYTQGMEWKRRIHARYGTTLLETTFAGVLWGDDLTRLGEELTQRGLTLDWNPDRPPKDQWAKPLKHEDMYRLVRTLMSHVKSGSWTRQTLEARLENDLKHLAGTRTRLFLDLYWRIASEWEARLADEGSVDFEDMLVAAAGYLESGRVDLGYELILVDELQDASQARGRLIRGLLAKPGRYLLAVGDDWQSINRFAGADLSVMTQFREWFGHGPQLALTTTFRCPQTICDLASRFVSKNPRQFKKEMRSAHAEAGPPVNIIQSYDAAATVAVYLKQLSDGVAGGTIPHGSSGTVTVDVLGRYNFEREVVPRLAPHNLDVTFRTIHKAKGLEADYIIVPNMISGTYGFPSTITDDPVLHLAMPAPDAYEHAEERRLFYVVLTRARRSVVLITDPRRMSPFVAELIAATQVTVDGQPLSPGSPNVSPRAGGVGAPPVQMCPRCNKGALVEKIGKYGPFIGCSTWPACDYTRSLNSRPPRYNGRSVNSRPRSRTAYRRRG